jgi:hypothetical protein
MDEDAPAAPGKAKRRTARRSPQPPARVGWLRLYREDVAMATKTGNYGRDTLPRRRRWWLSNTR